MNRREIALVGAAVAVAVALTQWMQYRPDPAAEPGVRAAVVLLLEADARIVPLPAVADLGARAERAALVRWVWDDAAQAERLAAAERGDATATAAPIRDPQTPVYFVVTRWGDVHARARRAGAEVVGHYSSWRDGVRRDEADRSVRVELARIDPVGRTRGWRLLSIS